MATEHKDPTAPTTDEAAENSHVWIELGVLQSIVVQSSLSQAVLRLMDKCLWTIEKCAEWSLPQEVAGDENGKASEKPELVRPLPWILFLPSLVILRTIRMTLNIGATITGYSQITPSRMVKFIQISRRHLNIIQNSETKENHDNKGKRSSMNEARRALIRSIRLTLSSLSCLDTSKPSLSPPPTRIYVSNVLDPDVSTTISEEKSMTESADSVIKPTDSMNSTESEKEEKEEEIKEEKEEEIEEEKKEGEEEEEEEEKEKEKEETLNEKINRLALESSEEDEDFDPADCSSISSNASSDEESNVSLTELHELIEGANVMLDKITLKYLKDEIQQLQDAERMATIREQRSPAEESCDNEERLSSTQRIDTPECYTPDRSSQEGDPIFYSPISSDSDTPKEHSVSSASIADKCVSRNILETNEFLNGEIYFSSASTISELKSSEKTNNGAIVEKRSTNVSKFNKGKRTNHGNRKKK